MSDRFIEHLYTVDDQARILAAEAAVELARFELEVARGVAALDLAEAEKDLGDGA